MENEKVEEPQKIKEPQKIINNEIPMISRGEFEDLKQFVGELYEKVEENRVKRVNELLIDLDMALTDTQHFLQNAEDSAEASMQIVKNKEYYLNKSGSEDNFINFLVDRLQKNAINMRLAGDIVKKLAMAGDSSKRKILNTLQ